MSCIYPVQRLSVAYTSTHNDVLHSAFGIRWPQGFLLACNGIAFNKVGVAEALNHWDLSTALFARCLGLVDTITFFITLPLMLLVYFALTLWAIIHWALLGWFMICAPPISPFYLYMKFLGMWAVCFIPTLLMIIGLTILTPLQIIVPELTVYLLQIHKW